MADRCPLFSDARRPTTKKIENAYSEIFEPSDRLRCILSSMPVFMPFQAASPAANRTPIEAPMDHTPAAAKKPITNRRWIGAAVLVVLLAATAFAMNQPAPIPITSLRVGLDVAAMPLSNGTRNYTDEGFEARFADELARHLGAEVILVPLSRTEQTLALWQGHVDVVLTRSANDASTADKVLALPTGFQSGLSVAMRSDTQVRQWRELAGQVVCASASNVRALALASALDGNLKALPAPAQALAQVRTGECAAVILDRAQLDPLFQRKEWLKFSATLPPTEPSRLVAEVSTDRPDLAATVRAAVAQIGTTARWDERREKWAANVAFEVYFDQIGPDCH